MKCLDTWSDFLIDCKNGRPKKKYISEEKAALKALRDEPAIYTHNYYGIGVYQISRGCKFNCDFCSIKTMYKGVRRKSADIIVEELKNAKEKIIFFVDDNLFYDKSSAIELFEKIAPMKKKWACQISMDVTRDDELLILMKKAGCFLVLMGFESLNKENLQQMNKSFNYAIGERDELVKRIHDAGIGIYATFVFGYDNDDERTINEAVEFAKKHNFYTAAFNHLLPFPNTALYERLKNENRLIYDKWWLAEDYNYGEVAFNPKLLSAEKLSRLCRDARKEFSSPKTVLSRGFSSLGRTSPLMWGLFWAMNLRLGEEIDQKMNVPIGENLDELPK